MKFQTYFSDIDEGQDLMMDKNHTVARFEPPKKILSILDGLDQEHEDKSVLHGDLRAHNLAIPTMSFPNKTGQRHPGMAYRYLQYFPDILKFQ